MINSTSTTPKNINNNQIKINYPSIGAIQHANDRLYTKSYNDKYINASYTGISLDKNINLNLARLNTYNTAKTKFLIIDKENKGKLFFNLDDSRDRLVGPLLNQNKIKEIANSSSYLSNHSKIPLINKHCNIYPSNEIDYVEARERNKIYSHFTKKN